MATNLKDFAESAKGFTKSPLGIIALFIILVYGFATLAVSFGSNLKDQVTPLIYFLVCFPVIVFCGFLWLVAKHHDKIYGPSDFKNEENFLRLKMNAVASLVMATAKNQELNKDSAQSDIDSIIDIVSNTPQQKHSSSKDFWENKLLWVDDNPGNNIHERKAFESAGIEITIALSTEEALNRLKSEKFAVIISDMGRKEGPDEGYVLLEALRKSGNEIPFFIYAGSNLPEHKIMTLERGAQGCTNRADELYKMVTSRIALN